MLQHTEQPTTTITEQPSPAMLPNFFAWGEIIGIILIAGAVLAKDFINRRDKTQQKQEESEDELIDFLKGEIAKRDDIIARLQNQIIITQKALDFSGEFAPPVSKERVMEVNNNNDNSHVYNRENS